MSRIRVLVVDDSAFMRKVVSDLLSAEPDIEVVGAARNGAEGLQKAESLAPDVVTLDVEMPEMNGLEMLERLMAERPLPVVMVSSLTQPNADVTVRALELGAVDFVAKPSGTISLDMHRVKDDLVRKVRAAAGVPRVNLARRARTVPPAVRAPKAAAGAPAAGGPRGPRGLSRLVVIGVSTGGPSALMEVIPRLPADFPGGILLVQHMPPLFTRHLAEHLDAASALTVREAREGDVLSDGLCLVAPGGKHLAFREGGCVSLDDSPPRHGVKPAVDVTLESAAERWRGESLVVIMTGMGMDGARGARAMKARGARVIAQDEATCVVYGMPRAVVEMGLADHVAPLGEIADLLSRLAANSVPA